MKEHVKMFENFEGGPNLGMIANSMLHAIIAYVEQWRGGGGRDIPRRWPVNIDKAEEFEKMDLASMKFFDGDDMGWDVPVPSMIDKTIDEFHDGLMDADSERTYEAASNQIQELKKMVETLPAVVGGRMDPNHYEVLGWLIMLFNAAAIEYSMERRAHPEEWEDAQPSGPAPSIDDILDKINRVGVQGISAAQRHILDVASGKKMSMK